jgi:hypothetical protein
MKTRTSIYHRTFAFAYVLLVAVIFCGCKDQGGILAMPEMKNIEDNITVEIDSCEYLKWRTSYSYFNITHKGNCKFCTDRSKK